MKFEVTYSCGHTGIVHLDGKMKDRLRKVEYFEKYGICPACYREEKIAKEEEEEGLVINVSYEPVLKQVVVFATGNSYAFKEQLKALGFCFGEIPVSEGNAIQGLSWLDPNKMRKPAKSYWYRAYNITEDNIDLFSIIDALINDIIYKCGEVKYVNHIDAISRQLMKKACVQLQNEKQEKEEKEAKVKAPQIPAFITGRWNKKIYGSEKYGYRVYLDGKETTITAEQKEELEKYLEEMKKK